MLAINIGENEETIFIFSADYPTEFPVLMDQTGAVIAEWRSKACRPPMSLHRMALLPAARLVAGSVTIRFCWTGLRALRR